MSSSTAIRPCEVCEGEKWDLIYSGPVLNGRCKGEVKSAARMCASCGVVRLDDSMVAFDYTGSTYRNKLKEPINADGFFETHDAEQIYKLLRINDIKIRGKKILDVGAAAGSFLDYVRGVAEQVSAVEPCRLYEDELFRKCYEVYPFIQNITGREYDLITCFDTLEHVQRPADVLRAAYRLLAPGGVLVASTGEYVALEAGSRPDVYFRTQHKWYWSEEAFLNFCTTSMRGVAADDAKMVLSTVYEPQGPQMYLRITKPLRLNE
jgi:2-polyprenyl-3-methyl-5-hydroxy-6-metoxy-1,4-benzoquinol methylase